MTRTKTAARPPIRALGYVRISKDRDDETSTRTQEADIRAFCERNRYTLVDIVVERGVSAFNVPALKRPGFRTCLRHIDAGAANMIVVWKLDRLERNALRTLSVVDDLRQRDAYFAAASDGIDTSGPGGELQLAVFAALAEQESRTKSERTLIWHEDRLAQALPPSGHRAFGYQRVDKTLVIDESEAAIVREAAVAVLDGESLRSIVRRFNEAGSKPRLADEWDRRSLKQMLCRPTLAGLRETKDGAFIEGTWPAILDRATFDELRSILLDPKRHNGGRSGRHWLLSGLARCGRCDTPIQFRPHQGKPRYACPNCLLSVYASDAEEVVETAVMGNLDPRTWKRLRRRGRHVDTTALESELDDLATQRADGEITPSEWKILRAGITRRIAEAQAEPVTLPNVDDVRKAWPTLSIEAKRLVITAAVESIVIEPAARGANSFDPERVQFAGWTI